MAISVAIDVRMMINGSKFCFAKFLDQSSFERIQNPDAICGNRDPLINRTAAGRRKIQFTTFHDITNPILVALLPLAGMTLATGAYTANQTVSTIPIIIDKVGAVHEYTNCRMTRMILRGQVGTMPVSMECTWIAEDELEDAATSWVDGTVDNLFGFPGTTYTVAAAAYGIDRFAFVIDNKLVQSWNASYTVTDVGPGPRQTLLATSVPYTVANSGVYWDNRDTTVGVALALVLTNGTDTMTINLPKAVLNPESPSIEGALEEIRLPQTWEAHRQSAVAAFNIVLTNT
jgi:hypothetical protein